MRLLPIYKFSMGMMMLSRNTFYMKKVFGGGEVANQIANFRSMN
jgi:hypothetical protein